MAVVVVTVVVVVVVVVVVIGWSIGDQRRPTALATNPGTCSFVQVPVNGAGTAKRATGG